MTTSTADKPDINEMRVIHRAFRREFNAVPGLIRRVPDGNVARMRIVAQHAQFLLTGLHIHHTGEDENLWPLLLERAKPSTELIETMQAQHERVHEHVDRCQRRLDTWLRTASSTDGEELAAAVEQLRRALFEHLDQEEQDILPLAEEYVTVEEWGRLGARPGLDGAQRAAPHVRRHPRGGRPGGARQDDDPAPAADPAAHAHPRSKEVQALHLDREGGLNLRSARGYAAADHIQSRPWWGKPVRSRR